VTAEEMAATGFDWDFSPTLAVVRDDRWGRTYEGFSEDPSIVRTYAGKMVEGLQGRAGTKDFLGPRHVMSSAKHFVGDGGTAGGDMFMAPDSWKGLYENTLKQVQSGEIPMSRLDDAVRRILRVKLRAHMFDKGAPSARPLGGHFELLGSAEHRAVARQAVRE